ncbi:GFA family protein [Undibacterium terreum]|uniref:Aldehyde-activating protein n=1 Tax=Undibacterium terreum TaxID=1224302 RepID=A0A916UB79_9BURK|nr:GFA family protein [Undibacterium terreum]GGC64679.1 aldehyde-activating protein [Undibacterium terreum]
MKTYHGSCHCGAVQFEAGIDLSAGTIKCNCTICTKLRFWPAIVKPEHFRLIAGDTELSNYRFNTKTDQHQFCKHCGVHPFVIGNSPRWGVFYGVNISCLDDAPIEELVNAPVTYLDGRNDNWDSPPLEVRHL